MVLFVRWTLPLLVLLTACQPGKRPVAKSILLHCADSLLYVSPRQVVAMTAQADLLPAAEADSLRLLMGKAWYLTGDGQRAALLFDSLWRAPGVPAGIRAQACFELAMGAYYQAHHPRCLHLVDSLAALPVVAHDSLLQGWMQWLRGKVWRVKGDFVRSQHCFYLARQQAVASGDHRLLVSVLLSMGKNALVEGNKRLAIDHYLEAYRQCALLNNPLLTGDVCNHLGSYYLLTNDPVRALGYHRQALAYRRLPAVPDEVGQSYINLGKCYLALQRTDSAEICFNQALAQFEHSGYMKGMVKTLTSLGQLHLQQHQHSLAHEVLLRAGHIARQSGYRLGMAETLLALGDYYRAVRLPRQAIVTYRKALGTIDASGFHDWLANVYQGMYLAAVDMGDMAGALNYHVHLLDAERQRLNVETNRQVSAVMLDFDFERQENVNRLLRKDLQMAAVEMRRNRWMMAFAVVAVLLVSVVCWIIYSRLRFREKAHRRLTALNDRVQQQNQELTQVNDRLNRVLRDKDKLFSIISHELRNPLFWFKNLTGMLSRSHASMSPDKLQRSMASLNESAQNVYHLMDNLLYWSRSQLNRIEPHMAPLRVDELLGGVLSLFSHVWEPRGLTVSVALLPHVGITADADLMACVFRNLLSNAVKFTPPGGHIRVSLCRIGSGVEVVIADNGPGLPEALLHEGIAGEVISQPGLLNEVGAGLGLRLCREFVAMHGGRLSFERADGGGTVARVAIDDLSASCSTIAQPGD
ncbi:ATP-binding protein [Breznakibacter xylanolyticus]|nr:ATP-binding protein [Breznakibacter xylanolyticus]